MLSVVRVWVRVCQKPHDIVHLKRAIKGDGFRKNNWASDPAAYAVFQRDQDGVMYENFKLNYY